MKASQFWQHCPQHGAPAVRECEHACGVATGKALHHDARRTASATPALNRSVPLAMQNSKTLPGTLRIGLSAADLKVRITRKGRRMRLASCLALLTVCFAQQAFGQVEQLTPSPPKMAACSSEKHPRLPEKWRATYLMAPFTSAQLVLAEIEHDSTVGVTRARLRGLKHGSVDLVTLGTHTYQLLADGQGATGCHDLGDSGWRPIRRDWLSPTAQCVGSAPIGDVEVDWWHVSAKRAHLANWMWFKTSDQTPFRLLLLRPSDAFGPLGLFALSNQVRFEPLRESTLTQDAVACRAAAPPESPDGRAAVRRVIAAMDDAPGRADGALKELMPEIAAACDSTGLPRWPDTFAASAFMTSLDLRDTTFPAHILYDWQRKAMRTRLYSPRAQATPPGDALLIGETGYGMIRRRQGQLSCGGPQPGVLRPDWPTTGGCSCEAVIGATTPLTPYGPARILRCPVTAPRVFWAWYTRDQRPMLFLETASGDETGAGLTLIDYYAWLPGFETPASAFARPAQCAGEPAYSGGKVCMSCHLGGNFIGTRRR